MVLMVVLETLMARKMELGEFRVLYNGRELRASDLVGSFESLCGGPIPWPLLEIIPRMSCLPH